jgi:hypothetical protein
MEALWKPSSVPAPTAWGGPASDLQETTQAGHRNAVEKHLRPRYGTHRLDTIDPDALAALVRELMTEGKSETTIAAVLGTVTLEPGAACCCIPADCCRRDPGVLLAPFPRALDAR